jgi:hypothetical protein
VSNAATFLNEEDVTDARPVNAIYCFYPVVVYDELLKQNT